METVLAIKTKNNRNNLKMSPGSAEWGFVSLQNKCSVCMYLCIECANIELSTCLENRCAGAYWHWHSLQLFGLAQIQCLIFPLPNIAKGQPRARAKKTRRNIHIFLFLNRRPLWLPIFQDRVSRENIYTPVARARKSRVALTHTHLWWETVSSARSRCSAVAASWSRVTSRWDRPGHRWLCSNRKARYNYCSVHAAIRRYPCNTHCSLPTSFRTNNWSGQTDVRFYVGRDLSASSEVPVVWMRVVGIVDDRTTRRRAKYPCGALGNREMCRGANQSPLTIITP